ncbi:hypothetical protein Neosp_002807 [[Neocosmospora] mangrovei]
MPSAMPPPRNPRTGDSLNWDPATSSGIAFSSLGATLPKISMATTLSLNGAAGAHALIGPSGWVISHALEGWAMPEYSEATPTIETIRSDRLEEGLDPDKAYVAICGPSGSGKSSLLHALRGLPNGDPDAASVGVTEVTVSRQEYQPAACFKSLCLVDFPGPCCQRVARSYFKTNKLHCYDTILIICGEKFGQIEISLVKTCIVQEKRFAIIRSRSDEGIRRVQDDKGISHDEAKRLYIQDEVDVIKEKLRQSSMSEEEIAELLGFFIFVNKNTLRVLTMIPPSDWPQHVEGDEIHERKLLRFLGKAGATGLHVCGAAEE